MTVIGTGNPKIMVAYFFFIKAVVTTGSRTESCARRGANGSFNVAKRNYTVSSPNITKDRRKFVKYFYLLVSQK